MANKNATAVSELHEIAQPGYGLKSYQKVHELTGEVVDKFKYLEGHPRQYRFDAKEGIFNINGTEKLGRTLTFQPIAWRLFNDQILGQPRKNWAEIFFVDEKNCVASVLFHSYSVDNIFKLIEPLYYDDLLLSDALITVVAEKKENTKIQPKGVYYIATFSYKLADVEQTMVLKQYAQEKRIYRQETLTDVAEVKTSVNFFNPFTQGESFELPEGVTNRQLNAEVEQHYQETQSEAASI